MLVVNKAGGSRADEHDRKRAQIRSVAKGVSQAIAVGVAAMSILWQHMDDQEWELHPQALDFEGASGGAGTAAFVS